MKVFKKLKKRISIFLFNNNAGIFINLYFLLFLPVEKMGDHKINKDGLWSANYKILDDEFYNYVTNKLDILSFKSKSERQILPFSEYHEKWFIFKKKHIYQNEELKKTLDQFFGNRKWKVGEPNIWRLKTSIIDKGKIFGDEKSDLSAVFWHTDDIRADYLKLFVNLMDIDENHGPFQAINANDSKLIIRKTKGADRFILKDEELSKKKFKAIGSKGALNFCTTSRCLHRGGFQKEGLKRDMMQIHFVLSNPFFN